MRYSDLIRQTIQGNTSIFWNYYSSLSFNGNLLHSRDSVEFIYQYFEDGGKELPLLIDPGEARDFISRYFEHGQKRYALSFERKEEQNLPDDRAVHTVSTFFLGLFIENCLNGQQTLSVEGSTSFPFVYLWFLTALYHDYGYSVSERENGLVRIIKNTTHPTAGLRTRNKALCFYGQGLINDLINEMKKDLGINLAPIKRRNLYARTDTNRINVENAILQELARQARRRNNQLHFNNGSLLPECRYKPETLISYYNYRINVWSAADHGIVGGFLFFDRMLKNYLVAYLVKLNDENGLCDPNDFIFRSRHYCADQLTLFSYISDCIMAHNIWEQPNNMRKEYEKYQLTQLYQENYTPINYHDNPLLFILAVTDTLEPLKVYKELSPQIVADSINLDYDPAFRKLSFSSCNNDVPIEVLYHKAKDLEEWANVRCSALSSGKFTVHV